MINRVLKDFNMKKFKICCQWTECGEYIVEANSLEEAIDKSYAAEDECSSLPKGYYVDESFRVNLDCCEELENEI